MASPMSASGEWNPKLEVQRCRKPGAEAPERKPLMSVTAHSQRQRRRRPDRSVGRPPARRPGSSEGSTLRRLPDPIEGSTLRRLPPTYVGVLGERLLSGRLQKTKRDVVEERSPRILPESPVETRPLPGRVGSRAPTPAVVPSTATAITRPWASLAKFAEDLPAPEDIKLPHPMLDHLDQRLGNAQRGKRPAVRTRHWAESGSLNFPTVTEANYQAARTAARLGLWTGPNDQDRDRLAELTNKWPRLEPTESLAAEWFAKLTVADFPPGKAEDPTKYQGHLESALDKITRWVEPGVLAEIGLPKVIVHGPEDNTLGSRPAFYDERTQEIHIKSTAVTHERILHEFGHHLEEQGPVEVWCGLASFMRRVSEDRPLTPPRPGETRETSYPYDVDSPPRVPNVGYAMSYYHDAGTELIALAFENELLDSPGDFADWKDEATSYYDLEFMALLLQAVRPQQLRRAGVSFPSLL
jgi:hypothetical protein